MLCFRIPVYEDIGAFRHSNRISDYKGYCKLV